MTLMSTIGDEHLDSLKRAFCSSVRVQLNVMMLLTSGSWCGLGSQISAPRISM
jgi:hypothetical protein